MLLAIAYDERVIKPETDREGFEVGIARLCGRKYDDYCDSSDRPFQIRETCRLVISLLTKIAEYKSFYLPTRVGESQGEIATTEKYEARLEKVRNL